MTHLDTVSEPVTHLDTVSEPVTLIVMTILTKLCLVCKMMQDGGDNYILAGVK